MFLFIGKVSETEVDRLKQKIVRVQRILEHLHWASKLDKPARLNLIQSLYLSRQIVQQIQTNLYTGNSSFRISSGRSDIETDLTMSAPVLFKGDQKLNIVKTL